LIGLVLAVGSIFGLWLAGRRPKAGWLWCMGMEIPWLIYAVSIDQTGLALLCGAYFVVYLLNGMKAKNGQ
jgi:hypothetical protein